MKRKRFIAGILALSMLLMGTGYAYWTDKLDITTKADTGELKVRFLDLALYGQYDYTDDETGWSIIDGVNTDATTQNYYFSGKTNVGNNRPDHNKLADEAALAAYRAAIVPFTNTSFNAMLKGTEVLGTTRFGSAYEAGARVSESIEITLNKMYPGYAQVFQADIANLGTLTARLSNIKVTAVQGSTNATKDMLGVSLHVLREYAGSTSTHVEVFKSDNFDDGDFFRLGNVDFIRLSALENLAVDIQNDLLYVSPDDNRMDVYFAVAMDPDAVGNFTSGTSEALSGKSDDVTELESATVKVDFLWDQFNEGDTFNGVNRLLNSPVGE